MIDTHAHLDFPEFDEDREEVIARFFENGGKAIVNIGVDLKTSRKSIELADNHENIFVAVGFHPHDAAEKLSLPTNDDIEKLKKIATHKKVKAIGEVGLDYFHYKAPGQIEQQKILFERQLKIADEAGLPVVIHCREAWEDLYEIISSFLRLNLKNRSSTFVSSKVRPFPPNNGVVGIPQGQTLTKFVLHCYSGERKDTEKFLELPNVFFSFSGNITYPKPIERAAKLAEAVRMIPLERMMLDSDSPFLAPQQARGKRNEPSYVRYIAEKIAGIKGISLEKVEKTTDENANEFFGLD